MKRNILIDDLSRHGQRVAYVMDESRSANIDELEDLRNVEFKIKNGHVTIILGNLL